MLSKKNRKRDTGAKEYTGTTKFRNVLYINTNVLMSKFLCNLVANDFGFGPVVEFFIMTLTSPSIK